MRTEVNDLKEIYLIRHGTTEENKTRIIIGKSDPQITDESRAYIRSIDVPFSPDIVYSSPLKRAYETATLLFPDLEIIVKPDLMERDYGDFEGKPLRDNSYALTDEVVLVDNGGEPLDKLEARVIRFIDILLNSDARKIAVVSHGVLISHIIRVLLGEKVRDSSLRNAHLVYFILDKYGKVTGLRYNISINEI